jgi:drug/metabolite transporter (DMT)-like permease
MSNNLRKGVYFAIVTAIISGFSVFFNKFAVGIIKPPLVFTALKNVEVGILIFAILLISKKLPSIKKLTRREIIYLFFIGLIGGSLPFYLFFTGLSQVSAINAALIQKTLVVWVSLLAIPFLKEKLSPVQILAVLLLFLGNLSIGGFKGFSFSTGELYILLATMLWSVEYIFAKKILPTVDPDIVTVARMGFGSLILLGVAGITSPTSLGAIAHLTATQWFIMTISVIALLGYVMTWYRALKFASAITVTSVLVSATLVTNILSAIFVTHSLHIDFLIQMGLIIAGVGLFVFVAKKENLIQKSEVLPQSNN